MTGRETQIEAVALSAEPDRLDKDRLRQLILQLTERGIRGGDDYADCVIANPNNHIFIAVDRATGGVAGLSILTVIDTFTRKMGYINDVVVDAAYRRHGVGRMLVDAMNAMARQMGCDFTDLTTSPQRQAAHNLYISAGFIPLKTGVYRFDLRERPAS